jgi:hypothetical protein
MRQTLTVRSVDMNDTNEPAVPTIDFTEPKQRPEFSRGRDISRPDEFKPVRRQGQRENADREEWKADQEQRKARTATQLAKRLRKGVQNAEKSLSGLIGSFSALVVEQLIAERFGRKVVYGNLGADTKRELRYHVRVASLSEYLPHVSAGVRDNDDEEKLFKRANDVANKLDDFKQHVEQEAH